MHNFWGVSIESLPELQVKIKGTPTPYFSRLDSYSLSYQEEISDRSRFHIRVRLDLRFNRHMRGD